MTSHPAAPADRDRDPVEYRRVRGFLLVCAFSAIIVGTIGQLVMPARGSPLLAWLDTAIIPALVTVLFVLSRPDRPRLLALTLGFVYLESVLTASLFAIGLAFSIVVPIIGIGLVGPHMRGRASVATYAGAWAIATLSFVIAETGNPPNPLGSESPVLTVVAFALIAAGALGLLWRSSDQQVRALAAADREIAARVAARTELERTAEFLETLVGSSPLATIALHQSGRVTLWNPAAVSVFGWTEAEVVGRPLPGDLVGPGPGGRPGLGDLIARSLAGEAIRGERVVTCRRDGTEVTVELHAGAHREAAQPHGVIVQAIDVTERSILEARLRQSQRLEAVGHLAGGIAHDINNALTAVGGFTEMIEAAVEDPLVKADARSVVEGVRRASQLTRQLLAFAQRSVLKPEVIDAAAFLTSIQRDLQQLVGSDVKVVIRAETAPAWVDVDPARFEQAVLSLAENAIDAMPGGGTLSITIARRDPPGPSPDPTLVAPRSMMPESRIVVTIADTGSGFEPALQDQAFEPYLSADERAPGGGLGLAMVHGFVSQSGGEVELHSEPGVGTSVEIRLPEAARPSDADLAREPLSTDQGPELRESAARGETILLIDDEPAVAELGRRVLARLGYDVIVAADGPAGIDVARTRPEPIHLVVSDVIMPGMLGTDAVAAIRAIHPEAAVLFASGYPADAITEDGVLPDGTTLIEKPFSLATLGSSVRSVLDQHTADAGAAHADGPDAAEAADAGADRHASDPVVPGTA